VLLLRDATSCDPLVLLALHDYIYRTKYYIIIKMNLIVIIIVVSVELLLLQDFSGESSIYETIVYK